MPWALLKPFLPYLIGLALLAGAYVAGDVHGHKVDTAAWQARWTARDLAETKAKDAALAAQKAAQDATDARNASIVETLSNVAKERDNALLDAQFARRLLAAAQAGGGHGAVPPASDQPGAAGAPGDAGDQSLAALIGDAGGECRRNTDRLWRLQAEIGPQLTPAGRPISPRSPATSTPRQP